MPGVSNTHAQANIEAHPDDVAVSLIRALACFCGGLAILSIFWPDWIEALTGYDPDQHNGSVEWLIVIALFSTAPFWRSRRRGPKGARSDDV
jgi:hypothetical protein